MDPNNLYVLYYRKGVKGATQGFITASSLKIAEALGQHFCDNNMNNRFIRVEPAIIADEADLPEHLKAALGIGVKKSDKADPPSKNPKV